MSGEKRCTNCFKTQENNPGRETPTKNLPGVRTARRFLKIRERPRERCVILRGRCAGWSRSKTSSSPSGVHSETKEDPEAYFWYELKQKRDRSTVTHWWLLPSARKPKTEQKKQDFSSTDLTGFQSTQGSVSAFKTGLPQHRISNEFSVSSRITAAKVQIRGGRQRRTPTYRAHSVWQAQRTGGAVWPQQQSAEPSELSA